MHQARNDIYLSSLLLKKTKHVLCCERSAWPEQVFLP